MDVKHLHRPLTGRKFVVLGIASLFLFALDAFAVSVNTASGALPVGRESASLNGYVEGDPVEVTFSWWDASDPGNPSSESIGTTNGEVRVFARNLTAGMDYEYNIQADGEQSETRAFSTLLRYSWFGGGGYDGYDQVRGAAVPGYPQIHNANGATNVTMSGAFLNGMLVHTGSAPAQVYVFWGKTDGLTDRDAWTHNHNLGVVDEYQPLTYSVSVESGSLYHYRFYATNTAAEEGWAVSSEIFQTPEPPAVTTGPGAAVGRTAAVLNGQLTAGLEAAVTVYWGEDPGDWANTISLGTLTVEGSVSAPNPFQITIDGLTPGTTYAYQVYAVNAYDEAEATAWFTTHPEDYVLFPEQQAWFGGGGYDGYDLEIGRLIMMPSRGSMFLIR